VYAGYGSYHKILKAVCARVFADPRQVQNAWRFRTLFGLYGWLVEMGAGHVWPQSMRLARLVLTYSWNQHDGLDFDSRVVPEASDLAQPDYIFARQFD